MKDTNNYPNYIGVESDIITSIKINLKYTGDSEKSVIVNEGSLVSIGRVLNNNGVLSYGIVMGIVKSIGMDKIRSFSEPPIGNPYYLVLDKSNTYVSDIETIYVRDIRDIIVGPMAEGNFAKGESSGPELPVLTETNKDMYEGRLFYVTDNFPSISDLSLPLPGFGAGLYYALDGEWKGVTASGNVQSSPLVASYDPYNLTFGLREDVCIKGTNITNIPLVYDNVFGGIACDIEKSRIRIWSNGDVITYQLHLVGLTLPADPYPEGGGRSSEGSDTPQNDNLYFWCGETFKKVICKPKYYDIVNLAGALPKHNTPFNTNRMYVPYQDTFYPIHHRMNTDGNIVIYYPNTEGITEMDLGGFYLSK